MKFFYLLISTCFIFFNLNAQETLDQKSSINIIGISIKTTNESGKAAKDILELWQRFFKENVQGKIPNIKSKDIYALYTDYEGDFTKPYQVIIGCEVENLNSIPEGMVAKIIPISSYAVFHAEGPQNILSTWQKIWQTKLNRTYRCDFEHHKITDPKNIEICVGIEPSQVN